MKLRKRIKFASGGTESQVGLLLVNEADRLARAIVDVFDALEPSFRAVKVVVTDGDGDKWVFKPKKTDA